MEEVKRRGRPRIHPLPAEDTPNKKRGRPRTKPIADPDAPKKQRGRKPRIAGVIRTNLWIYVTAEQEEWLARIKTDTGLSYGEIIDRIMEKYHGKQEAQG